MASFVVRYGIEILFQPKTESELEFKIYKLKTLDDKDVNVITVYNNEETAKQYCQVSSILYLNKYCFRVVKVKIELNQYNIWYYQM